MTRLFVALAVPDAVAQSLMPIQGGVPGARWQSREQLHLTLGFAGEADGRAAAMLDDALAGIAAPGFTLQLHGVGQFGNKQPHALWAGVRPNPALEHLQRKVDGAIKRAGLPRDGGKFMPHVTLARLRHGERIIEWLTHNALYTSAEFPVRAFYLYSSLLTSDGSVYVVEQSYALEDFNGETDPG
jgi:2'-5' RNA ligase